MQRAPSWISLWVTDDPRLMVAACGHGRTRTHWQRAGATPRPEELAVVAVLGHVTRTGCECGAGMWQAGPPGPRICMAGPVHHDRRLDATSHEQLRAWLATEQGPAAPPAPDPWKSYR